MPEALTIDLVRHMKARNAGKWTAPDNERPLSRLGRKQAKMHAEVMAQGDPIVALYASPALRCRQTLGPLVRILNLEVQVEPLLAETGIFAMLPIGAANPWLAELQEAHPDGGRIVACSHGDTIPAFLASLAVEPYVTAGAVIKGFGGWFRVRIDQQGTRIERFDVPEGFPTD